MSGLTYWFFGSYAGVIDHDVHIADQLGVSCVGVKGIVVSVDMVEVNVVVKEDVCPELIRKVKAVWSDDAIVLGTLDINEVG